MDPMTRRRVAMNQAMLRTANEGMQGSRPDGIVAFLCECGQLGCNQLIGLTRAEYEAVRTDARRFAVAPGHVVPELEREVECHDGYTVVETHLDATEFARLSDARGARRV